MYQITVLINRIIELKKTSFHQQKKRNLEIKFDLPTISNVYVLYSVLDTNFHSNQMGECLSACSLNGMFIGGLNDVTCVWKILIYADTNTSIACL